MTGLQDGGQLITALNGVRELVVITDSEMTMYAHVKNILSAAVFIISGNCAVSDGHCQPMPVAV